MKDMTSGKPLKIIFLFSMPILFGSIFQQFYNMVDIIMVGKILGLNALAAMGATSAILGLVLMLAIGMITGYSIPIARYYGADDHERMKKAVANTITFSIITGILLTILSLLLSYPILSILDTPADIIDMSNGYLYVMFGGTIITVLYNVGACILRAVGDSKTPLYFLIFSSILNIFLDYVFIAMFGFGIDGAAYATLIAQALSVILCFVYLIKKYQFLIPEKKDFKIEKAMALDQLGLGISMGLMNSIVSVGSVILQSAVNGLGATTLAAHTAARKISEMLMQPMGSIGMATTTFASQNFGAKKYHRIHEGVKQSILLSSIWSLLVVLLSFTVITFFIKFFVDAAETEVIATAAYYMRINSICYFVLGALFVYRNVLQGLGKKVVPILSSFVELVVKVATTFALTPLFGYTGIVLSEPLSWILMTILLYFGYRHYIKNLPSIDLEPEEVV